MIGFDSIGQAAIGETTGGSDDLLIFVPAANATVTVTAPAVAGGKSVVVPGKAAAAALVAPSVLGGVLIIVPGAAATASLGAPRVQISATVTVSGASASAAILPPRIDSGVLANVPAKDATVALTAPTIAAGKQIVVPGNEVSASLPAPIVAIGYTTYIGQLEATASLPLATQILVGNYIEVSNTILMSTPYGEIGSASIGEFSIGEGEPSSRTVKRGLLASVSLHPPFIAAGKQIVVPSGNATVTLMAPEIAARRRKIAVLAIAS